MSTPGKVVRTLDLRGVGCPLNYVKLRVALDRVVPGEQIELWLDPGEPEENVPRSCQEDGIPVVEVRRDPAGHVRLVVERAAS